MARRKHKQPVVRIASRKPGQTIQSYAQNGLEANIPNVLRSALKAADSNTGMQKFMLEQVLPDKRLSVPVVLPQDALYSARGIENARKQVLYMASQGELGLQEADYLSRMLRSLLDTQVADELDDLRQQAARMATMRVINPGEYDDPLPPQPPPPLLPERQPQPQDANPDAHTPGPAAPLTPRRVIGKTASGEEFLEPEWGRPHAAPQKDVKETPKW